MEKFIRGCFYGSVLGDCCGAPFELKNNISQQQILTFFNSRLSGERTDTLQYTDDSEMALCICESLMRCNGFVVSDLAATFSRAFDAAPSCRLYGASIGALFRRMKANKFSDPIKISCQQFNGSGSYGNGGGMRIAPAALYGIPFDDLEFNALVCNVTAITHTNALGLLGAVLQAHAIKHVLKFAAAGGNAQSFEIAHFVDNLRRDIQAADLSAFKFDRQCDFRKTAVQSYCDKLDTVERFALQKKCPTTSEIVTQLGNGEPALESIPTAIYVFLRCLKPMKNIPFESLVLRCSVYASMIGWDTDTIGSMACAIAGALVGAEKIEDCSHPGNDQIPGILFGHVEGLSVINKYTDWLIQHVTTHDA